MAFHVSNLEGSKGYQHKEIDAQWLKIQVTSVVTKLSQDVEVTHAKEHHPCSSGAALAHGPSSTKTGFSNSRVLTMVIMLQVKSDFFLYNGTCSYL